MKAEPDAGTLPLVRIDGAPDTGVYTLAVNTANGAAAASDTVTFTYGRYPGGRAQCQPATPPL